VNLRVDHFIPTLPAKSPHFQPKTVVYWFIAPFFFIHVPIMNLIPSYDSRQGRFRQVPVGHSWRAVGRLTAAEFLIWPGTTALIVKFDPFVAADDACDENHGTLGASDSLIHRIRSDSASVRGRHYVTT
jgi:hypothetical protein